MTAPALNLLGLMVTTADPMTLEPLRQWYDRPALIRPPRHQLLLKVTTERQTPGPNAFTVRTHTSQVQVTPESQNSVWIHGKTHDAHLSTSTEQSVLTLHGQAHQADEPLMVAFIEVLRSQGFIPLHGAILERNGQALALFGPSGTGKSTTMLRALQAGYRPVSEDYALYEPGSGLVYGLDLGLRCLPDTLERVRTAFALHAEPEFKRGKALITWEMMGLQQVWHAQFSAASSLKRDANLPSGEVPLPLPQRVMTLWAATGVPLLPGNRDWTNEKITRLAQELTWSERILGSTPVAFS